jgi:3-hydroxyacyl-[acyl-carrier-protein] dehydratase
MRWRLLEEITQLMPGRCATAFASTRFPDELFRDHFPSYPITPGVLLLEMGTQLSGLLTQATVMESDRKWIFPMLGSVQSAKFFSPVMPNTRLRIESELESARNDAAMCRARVLHEGKCCARFHLMLVFDANGGTGTADRSVLEAHSREEFMRLNAPWKPPDRRAGSGR